MIVNNNENVNSVITSNYPIDEDEVLANAMSFDEMIEMVGWTPQLAEENIQQKAKAGDVASIILLKRREYRKNFSIINYGGKTFVHSKKDSGELEFQDFRSFKEFNGSDWIDYETTDDKGKIKTKRMFFANEFLIDKFAKKFDGMEFMPIEEHTSFLNLWKGWKIASTQGNVDIFLKLIESLCNDDKNAENYLLDYLAHLVQKPMEKPEVAIVMRGEQGVGKGSLMKLLARFNDNFKHLSSSQSLVGQFSGHLQDAYIVFADESVWGGDKQAEGRLKALITEEKISIRAMRKDEVQIRSFVRLFVASNESWAVPVGEGDRRYFVLDCSSRYKGHTQPGQFFHVLNKWMDEGGAEAVFHFLQNRDISSFNPRVFPKTKARTELQKLSLAPAPKFLYEMLSGQAPMSDDTMDLLEDGIARRFKRNSLYADFSDWCKTHNRGYVASVDEFGKTIARTLQFSLDKETWKTSWCKKVNGKNEYFYQIPSMAEAQRRFAKVIFDAEAQDVFFNYENHKNDETPFR